MYTLKTQIEINAPKSVVWDILADVDAYPEWNSLVTELKGDLAPGRKITVKLQQPGSKPMSFSPKVLSADLDGGLIWKGKLFIPGVFDGEHHFELDATGSDQCVFRHFEVYRGVLVPLLKKMLETQTKTGFEHMNNALKRRAENN